jgi:hypothetical protein
VITAANSDQIPVSIIEIEKPLRICPRDLAKKSTKTGGILIVEELYRHAPRYRTDSFSAQSCSVTTKTPRQRRVIAR